MTDKPRPTALRLHKALYPIWRNDPGWKGVLTTVNNNTIGNMFILGAAGMFLAGGILAYAASLGELALGLGALAHGQVCRAV